MTPADLAATLRSQGDLAPAVYDAFAAVRRERFVPEAWQRDPLNGVHTFLTRSDDQAGHAAWLQAVYGDHSLVTRLDANGVAVSSSSQPSLMARMLDALGPAKGRRVLEIGTGTGYNAALLAELVGDENVTSIDIDPELVDTARTRLAAEGHRPHLIAGDGRAGHESGGPYGRLIATCETGAVPAAWVRQCRPGAVLVVNIGYGTARLVVGEDGARANGRFLGGYSASMPARDRSDDVGPPSASTPATSTRPTAFRARRRTRSTPRSSRSS